MIETHTLTDGGQSATEIAALLATFLSGAQHTLDIALYDFALSQATAQPVVDAIRDAVGRGVRARLLYNVDHERPVAIPPPPRTDPALIAATGAEAKPVFGIPDLMHHKYAVRDSSSVWTGSTNWTDDAFTREENVIVVVDAEAVAAAYVHDFEDLWEQGNVAVSGKFTPTAAPVGGTTVRPLFCPGRATRLTNRIAGAITRATQRIRIASPVITSGPILGALAETATAGHVDVAGVYDATQMREVFGQWRSRARSSWKTLCFETMVGHAPFGAKVTTPYAPGSVHDYMHAKVLVADGLCFVGSYNFSHSGEQNAENVLEIADPALADRLATFIDEVRARYSSSGPPSA